MVYVFFWSTKGKIRALGTKVSTFAWAANTPTILSSLSLGRSADIASFQLSVGIANNFGSPFMLGYSAIAASAPTGGSDPIVALLSLGFAQQEFHHLF